MNFYVDKLSFNNKPDKKVVGKIRNNIKRKYGYKPNNSMSNLISSIEDGKTIQLGIFDKDNKFISQSILMLDFDNPTQNKAELFYIQNNKFILDNACFIYKSFSYKEDIPKFRVVFILDNPLTSEEQVKQAYQYLISQFPQSDKVVGQPNRLFFGSNQKVIEINFNSRLSTKKFMQEFDNEPIEINKFLLNKQDSEETTSEILDSQFNLINNLYNKKQHDKYSSYPIFKLFQLKQFHIIKEKFEQKYGKQFSYTFPDPINASKVFKHELDMIDFLELPVDKEGTAFSDIFTEDSTPSASIYRHEKSNVQLYKRFSDNGNFKKTYDLILLLTELSGLNYITITEKLIEITGSVIDTNSNVYKHKMGVKMFQMFISESETDDLYPYFMNIIRPNTAIIITLLDIMSHSYKQVDNEVFMLNNMSVRYLTNQVNRIHSKNYSPQKIAKILDQLAMFAVTKKLKDSEVPKQILAPLISQKADKQFKNRANITKVNVDKDNVTNILNDGNIKSKNLIENNFSMRIMNFDFILSVLGEQEALNVYPQKYTHRKEEIPEEAKQKFEERQKAIAVNVLNLVYKDIDLKGYALERDVKQEYLNLGFSENDFKIFKPKLINDYGLIRLKFSKQRKINLKADIEGFPYFYTK